MKDDGAVLTRTTEAMDAGAAGVICGRNIWQREHDESLRFVARFADILSRDPCRRDEPSWPGPECRRGRTCGCGPIAR